MTTTIESLKSAERAYKRAPVGRSEPARLARRDAVLQAIADGWTQRRIATAMGKSPGWVSQLVSKSRPKSDPRTVAYAAAATDAEGDAARHAADHVTASTPDPSHDRARAIDRFRKAGTE